MEFGEAVKQLMQARGLTNRGVTIKTSIDHGTVNNMRQGMVPKKGVILDFALGLGENVNEWLVLCGYDPIPEELVSDVTKADRVREAVTEYLVNTSPGDIIAILTKNPDKLSQSDRERIIQFAEQLKQEA